MANGYEQFFKRAKQNSSDAPVKASMSTDRWAIDSQPTDRIVKSDASRAEMIQELRRRVQKRKTRKARKFPKGIVMISVIGSGLAGFGMSNYERVEKLFGQIEIAVLGQAHAEEAAKAEGKPTGEKEKGSPGEEKKPAEGAKATEKVKGEKGEKAGAESQTAVSATDWKEEEVNHFRKLVDRKKELDAREEELNRQETELQAQRDDLEKKLKSLASTRQNISNVLQEKVAEDEKKVESLVNVYSSMKPQQAAKVLESMDEDLAVQIIGRMKKKNAAEILNLMKPEKAQVFSERFAGYRKN